MSILTYLLISHVIIGIIAVMASYAVLMGLLKRKINLLRLRFSAVVAFVSYFISWITAGTYYVVHYGESVKPIIKAGDYPWAHGVVTESKEHIFLFLPILSFIILLVLFLSGDFLEENKKLKRALAFVAGITFFIGVAITLSGIIMSGAVR